MASETGLERLDRAADARARIYASELRCLIATARSVGSWSVPVSALERLADRMDGDVSNVVALNSYSRKV